WDSIRPKAVPGPGEDDPGCNVVAVQLEDPAQLEAMRQLLETRVDRV
ncbi:MAG: hypothetical protein GWN58_65555, partial [Anaerolineae bacterium]|nr:hypothetical protein [Anaerolineae bacterium]